MAESSVVRRRPLRRDAAHNRELILAAARCLFAERGLSVTMDEIAERAGVGVGTAYRRFSNRDELINALFEDGMLTIVALAEEALERPDPWDGLEYFLRSSTELRASDRGLSELMFGCDNDALQRLIQIRNRIIPLVEKIAARVIDSGAARPDLAPLDIPILSHMLMGVVEFGREVDSHLWHRYLTLLIDSLRCGNESLRPLPHPPLTTEQFDRAMTGCNSILKA